VIEVDVVDGIGVVRLAHGKVNALDLELCQTMRELDDRDGPVLAVVVTGAGRAFSAGVDLKRVVDGGAAYVAEFLPALGPVRARQVIFDGAGHEPAQALALGLVDELSAQDALLDQAVAVAVRMATGIPADAFRHTKAQLRHEVNERLDRIAEPDTVELWTTAATDGRIRAFMDRTTGGRR
jgi:enoyl-CoA hydratase/carnithine racemase